MIVKNIKEFHKEVCKRDGYICQRCWRDYNFDCYFLEDGRNAYVCGHHLKTQKARPELKLETDNGQCVCKICHNEKHHGNS